MGEGQETKAKPKRLPSMAEIRKRAEKARQAKEKAIEDEKQANSLMREKRNSGIFALGEGTELLYRAENKQGRDLWRQTFSRTFAKNERMLKRATDYLDVLDVKYPTDKPARVKATETAKPETPPATAEAGKVITSQEAVFLISRFEDKEEIKAVGGGAEYNSNQRAWCVPAGSNLVPYAKWINNEQALKLGLAG
jgi:hypothetical protein